MPTKPAPKKTAVKRSNKPNIAKARQSPLVKFGKAKAEPLVRGHVLRPVQYPELLSFAHIMDDEKVVLSFKTEAGEKTITIEGPVEYNLNVPGYIGCGWPSLLSRYQPDFGGGQITIQTAYGSFGPFHFARRLTSRVLWFAAEIEAMLAKKAGE